MQLELRSYGGISHSFLLFLVVVFQAEFPSLYERLTCFMVLHNLKFIKFYDVKGNNEKIEDEKLNYNDIQ
ncbi:CLUMA_CG020248, isoform A [Clunio marinus]|uniref:CLUMA_CG020248, isoform A n=1 Tax=Clunio marinus TaxID=568069 RepID=A0A1J1J4D3_9DIPT|nr:CLUMA_CG020248, isoform A [Clunio marinus]